jgi:periplasmic protein TonB
MFQQATLENATLEPGMFADSMLEVSWGQRARRSLMTLSSFGLQAVIIGLLLLAPLLRTVGLPNARTVSTPISAGRRDPEPVAARPRGGSASAPTTLVPIPFVQPGHIPDHISQGEDESSAPAPADPVACAGCTPSGAPDGLRNIFSNSTNPPLPAPPAPAPPSRVFRTSTILQGSLIHSVQPVYPALARTAHIQGSVVLTAVISKAGTMDDVRVVRGHPMLVGAAVDAVSQWRYRPYILNNEAIEVETQITVNFTLAGN